jgi:acetyl esterase/lipase
MEPSLFAKHHAARRMAGGLLGLGLMLAAQTGVAQERRMELPTPPRWINLAADGDLDDGSEARSATLPVGVRILRDLPYGSHPLQRMDVYLPQQATAEAKAPVILMVHGGGWRRGDKDATAVITHKVEHWVPQGYVVVSINYRLLPEHGPLQQVQDLADALINAQSQAARWGGNADRFILMGHSAGAHLVALLSASPEFALMQGAKPWLGAVLLDSAALDVEAIMQGRHLRLYDAAFGNSPGYWRAASPAHALANSGPAMLAVCSTRRSDSCTQADHFAALAAGRQRQVSVLRQNASHREINQLLGQPGPYTAAVDHFIATLHPQD